MSTTKVSGKKKNLGSINSMTDLLFCRKVISTSKPSDFIKKLNAKHAGITDIGKLPTTIIEIVKAGLNEEIEAWLLSLSSSGIDEKDVVIAFLYAISQSSVGEQLDRSLNRVILKAYKQSNQNENLDDDLKHCLSKISDKVWNWQAVPITL